MATTNQDNARVISDITAIFRRVLEREHQIQAPRYLDRDLNTFRAIALQDTAPQNVTLDDTDNAPQTRVQILLLEQSIITWITLRLAIPDFPIIKSHIRCLSDAGITDLIKATENLPRHASVDKLIHHTFSQSARGGKRKLDCDAIRDARKRQRSIPITTEEGNPHSPITSSIRVIETLQPYLSFEPPLNTIDETSTGSIMLQPQDTVPRPQNLHIGFASSSRGGDSAEALNRTPAEYVRVAACPSYPVVNTSTMAPSPQDTLNPSQSRDTIPHNDSNYMEDTHTNNGSSFDGYQFTWPQAQHLDLIFTEQELCDNIVRSANCEASVGLWWDYSGEARFSFHIEDGMDSTLTLALYGVRIKKEPGYRAMCYGSSGKMVIEKDSHITLTEAVLEPIEGLLGPKLASAITTSAGRMQELLWGGMKSKTNRLQMKIYGNPKNKTRVDVWANVDSLTLLVKMLSGS